MNILTYDTSSIYLDLCLTTDYGKDNSRQFTHFQEIGFSHGEYLVPSILELCGNAGIALEHMDLIACTRGPGSFTGLRIGLSTAKGISAGGNIPIVSIPTLDAYYEAATCMLPAGKETGLIDSAESTPDTIVPVLDARKKRFYTALYTKGKRISDYLDVTASDFMEKHMPEETCAITIFGPDAVMFNQQLSAVPGDLDTLGRLQVIVLPYKPISEYIIKPALAKFSQEGTDTPNQGPIYIRGSV